MLHTNDEVRERCSAAAQYMIENNATVRATAVRFGISKSTVHKDITERLEKINPELYEKTQEVLKRNKAERHLRGGEATKRKYLNEKIKKMKKEQT